MSDENEIELFEEEKPWKYILGIDPGGTTGVAMIRYLPEEPESLPELVYLDQIPNGHQGYWEMFEGSTVVDDIQPVSEKWVERNVKGADREPLVIEGIQYALWQDTVAYQVPAMKSLVSDDYLKEQGLWTEGKRHQMDALIHALVYLRNSGENDALLDSLAEGGQGEQIQLAMQTVGQAAKDAAEKIAEAFKGLGEALKDAQPEGPSGDKTDMNIEWDREPEEYNGRKTELNGSFSGYKPDDSGAKDLFSD